MEVYQNLRSLTLSNYKTENVLCKIVQIFVAAYVGQKATEQTGFLICRREVSIATVAILTNILVVFISIFSKV